MKQLDRIEQYTKVWVTHHSVRSQGKVQTGGQSLKCPQLDNLSIVFRTRHFSYFEFGFQLKVIVEQSFLIISFILFSAGGVLTVSSVV